MLRAISKRLRFHRLAFFYYCNFAVAPAAAAAATASIAVEWPQRFRFVQKRCIIYEHRLGASFYYANARGNLYVSGLCQLGLSVTIKRLINLLQTLDMTISVCVCVRDQLALISISGLSMKVPTVPSIN